MSKRYAKDSTKDSKEQKEHRDDIKTTIKKKETCRVSSNTRDDVSSRVITQMSADKHNISTSNTICSGIRQSSSSITKSGVRSTLVRSTTITQGQKKASSKAPWHSILNEVDFLKRKISEIERPTFGKPRQRPVTERYNNILAVPPFRESTKEGSAVEIFGRDYSLQSYHLLYEQINCLRRENQMLRQNLKQSKDELSYEREEAVKLSAKLTILTKENQKLRNQFLAIGKFHSNESGSEKNNSVSTSRQTPIIQQSCQKTINNSAKQSTVLKEITNRPHKTFNDHVRPSNMTSTFGGYDSENALENILKRSSTETEENLLDDIQPQSIDKKLKELNEKFQILLFNSKVKPVLMQYESGRQGRRNIKQELFAVTSEIKALQQQKALSTYIKP